MDLIEFDTAWYGPEERHATFLQTLVSLLITPVGDPLSFSVRNLALPLHPMILYRNTLSPVTYIRRDGQAKGDPHDHYSLTIVARGHAEGKIGGREIRCGAGDALLADHRESMEIVSPEESTTYVALMPRNFLCEVLPGLHGSHVLPAGVAVEAVRLLIDHLIDGCGELEAASAPYYARTVRELIAAAALSAHRALPRRTPGMLSLLEQVRLLIDAELTASLTPAAICQLLGVSRSALYRATAVVGGVQRLIRRRRLQAVYRALLDPTDSRSVSLIAQDCGYTSLSQFSRDFQRTFAMTARDLRATKTRKWPAAGSRELRLRRLLLSLAEQEELPELTKGSHQLVD